MDLSPMLPYQLEAMRKWFEYNDINQLYKIDFLNKVFQGGLDFGIKLTKDNVNNVLMNSNNCTFNKLRHIVQTAPGYQSHLLNHNIKEFYRWKCIDINSGLLLQSGTIAHSSYDKCMSAARSVRPAYQFYDNQTIIIESFCKCYNSYAVLKGIHISVESCKCKYNVDLFNKYLCRKPMSNYHKSLIDLVYDIVNVGKFLEIRLIALYLSKNGIIPISTIIDEQKILQVIKASGEVAYHELVKMFRQYNYPTLESCFTPLKSHNESLMWVYIDTCGGNVISASDKMYNFLDICLSEGIRKPPHNYTTSDGPFSSMPHLCLQSFCQCEIMCETGEIINVSECKCIFPAGAYEKKICELVKLPEMLNIL